MYDFMIMSSACPVTPAVIIVHFNTVGLHAIFEHLFEIVVIRSLLEIQRSAVNEELFEDIRQTFTQPFNWN